MPQRDLPGTASIARPDAQGKLYAPSAERNLPVLCDLLSQVAPRSGTALELASGTGQHVVGYAALLPGLDWQPSEIDAARRTSIDAHAAETGLSNIAPALALDLTAPGWATDAPPADLIVLSNLLHLISTQEAHTLIREAATALRPGGRFVLYGPFMRDGELTSPGDASFHASLNTHDPEIGYKNDLDVIDWLQEAGLTLLEVVEMPANNLALVSENPAA